MADDFRVGVRLEVFEVDARTGEVYPASAGEPGPRQSRRRRDKVYPRECGGTTRSLSEPIGLFGLSPRERGNQRGPGRGRHLAGSIPASAGEPTSPRCIHAWTWTRSPSGWLVSCSSRMSGGACAPAIETLWCKTSPEVRNTRANSHGLFRDSPRIWASAGSSPSPATATIQQVATPLLIDAPHRIVGVRQVGERPFLHHDDEIPVYPRECGGTCAFLGFLGYALGLSPRVRGNPHTFGGECGGTAALSRAVRRGVGLSPRVRGNPQYDAPTRVRCGSIPASAGEPAPRRLSTFLCKVYPRECGGCQWQSKIAHF